MCSAAFGADQHSNYCKVSWVEKLSKPKSHHYTYTVLFVILPPFLYSTD